MIIGRTEDIAAYRGISENLDRAIEYARKLDPALPCGRHEIDGDRLYVNVVSGVTSPLEDVVFEAHKKYLDLHLVIEGGETVVYAPISSGAATTEYDEAGDVWFFKGEGTPIAVNEGEFYIVHPFDLHAPAKGREPKPFKKAIIKIKI